MLKVALKGLAGRKLRAALTAFAIVLGVAMVSGTYVLTDTIKAGLRRRLHDVYKNTDAVITRQERDRRQQHAESPPSFSASLLAEGARRCPASTAAAGGVGDQASSSARTAR